MPHGHGEHHHGGHHDGHHGGHFGGGHHFGGHHGGHHHGGHHGGHHFGGGHHHYAEHRTGLGHWNRPSHHYQPLLTGAHTHTHYHGGHLPARFRFLPLVGSLGIMFGVMMIVFSRVVVVGAAQGNILFGFGITIAFVGVFFFVVLIVKKRQFLRRSALAATVTSEVVGTAEGASAMPPPPAQPTQTGYGSVETKVDAAAHPHASAPPLAGYTMPTAHGAPPSYDDAVAP